MPAEARIEWWDTVWSSLSEEHVDEIREDLQERQSLVTMMGPLSLAEVEDRERRARAIVEQGSFDQVHLSAYWLLNLDIPRWKAALERTRRTFTRIP